MRIWVTGKNGQLGSEIQAISKEFDADFFFTGSSDVDISNLDQVSKFMISNEIDAVINCAAYTAVDNAEDDSIKADSVNRIGVENIAKIAAKLNAKLVQVSTDYVFGGDASVPYKTSDEVNPIGVYGETKRNGEIAALNNNLSSIVIRTAWVYSTFGNNFVKTMLRLGADRDLLTVVGDQFGSPTYAKDLAVACVSALMQNEKWNSENRIYHFTNQGITNWSDFATEIMKQGGLNCEVKPITTAEYPTKAKRPAYSVLDKSDFEKDFNFQIRDWKVALNEMIESL